MTITVEDTDIRAAVAAGYLTEAQAANLLGLAAARQTSAGGRRMDDEPFQLFRGFNEVFITVGLLMPLPTYLLNYNFVYFQKLLVSMNYFLLFLTKIK